MPPCRIAIVGPGAIGGLCACRFAAAGHDVILLDHDSTRARRISRLGILLEDAEGRRRFPVPATVAPQAVGPVDMLCVCVKAFDTADAIQHAQPLIRHRTIVLSLQNGLGNAEVIARWVPPARIVCAATAQGALRVNSVRIRHTGFGPTSVAPYIPAGARVASLVRQLFRSAGFETTLVKDFRVLAWSKLIVNAAINPVTALWNVFNGEILTRPALLRLALAAAREAQQVAIALGVKLTWFDSATEVKAVCRATRRNRSSMQQDIRRGRRTEIDSITGPVVREAAALGIDTPVNSMLLRRLLTLEKGTHPLRRIKLARSK